MILKTNVGEFCLHFRHTNTSGRWVTLASLHKAPCANEDRPCLTKSLTGRAWCNPSDQFSKKAGRKLALQRAVASLGRNQRRLIWKAYFDRVRP